MAEQEPLGIASDGLPARLTGPWVLHKKHYFERYLDIFTRGVRGKWQGKLSYVDLFAGPGRSIIRDSGQELEGSPFLSLRYAFSRYVFVDVPDVALTLKDRLNQHPQSSKVSVIEGDCNSVVDKVLATMPTDYLTLIFIDPTGLQIKFRTIQKLVHNRSVDLLMTLQFGMGIKMNLPQYLQTEGKALSDFLGNSEWREDAKLGGSASQITRRILGRYESQLRGLGYETVWDREIDIRSQTNLGLYFMVLASRHPLGGDFWRKATQIGPSGQRLLRLTSEE